MNDTTYQQMIQKAVKERFKGKKELACRTKLRYPDTAEREFQRLTNAYVRILNTELKKRLPGIIAEYKRSQRLDARFDAVPEDLNRKLREAFREIAKAVEQLLFRFGLEERLEKIANMAKNNSYREWRRAVHDTLRIDLLSDYYNADFYADALNRWIASNVAQIKSIPNTCLDRMQQILHDGFLQGKLVTDIQHEIQSEYGLTKSKARMIARDQLGSLNSTINELQQRDAGVEKYKWSSSKDSRVRDAHREFDGKIYKWSEVGPEDYYVTKSRGKVYTGHRYSPGQAVGCRCVALPVFDFSNLKVPVKGTDYELEL